VRLAGQITGVEGYLESAATGLLAALYLLLERRTSPFAPLPATTALGALARHLTASDPARFQPANVNYGLFPPLPGRASRGDRRAAHAARAASDFASWCSVHGVAAVGADRARRVG
jgi:methylenetetrahydrofolate--tRNA-(uracil-5-)-methyltransferase